MKDFLPTDLGYHPGYFGVLTRQQAPGAMANGTRIVKIAGADEGGQPLGAKGAVLGSMYQAGVGYAYFVEWDAVPNFAVLCIEWKIGPDQTAS